MSNVSVVLVMGMLVVVSINVLMLIVLSVVVRLFVGWVMKICGVLLIYVGPIVVGEDGFLVVLVVVVVIVLLFGCNVIFLKVIWVDFGVMVL